MSRVSWLKRLIKCLLYEKIWVCSFASTLFSSGTESSVSLKWITKVQYRSSFSTGWMFLESSFNGIGGKSTLLELTAFQPSKEFNEQCTAGVTRNSMFESRESIDNKCDPTWNLQLAAWTDTIVYSWFWTMTLNMKQNETYKWVAPCILAVLEECQ